MDMLVFPGTARLLGDQLFQGPLSYTLANQAKLYSGVHPSPISYTLGKSEDKDQWRRWRKGKSIEPGTMTPSQPNTRWQWEPISVQMSYRLLEAAFNWHVLGLAKVWDAKRPQQHLLHPGPTLWIGEDPVPTQCTLKGLGRIIISPLFLPNNLPYHVWSFDMSSASFSQALPSL